MVDEHPLKHDRKAGGLALWLLLLSLVAQAFVPAAPVHARAPALAAAGGDVALVPPGAQKAAKLKARGHDDDAAAGPDTPDDPAHALLRAVHAQRFAPANLFDRAAQTALLPHPGLTPYAPRAPPAA